MMVATSGEEDELSMTVSDLSEQGRRVSDRSGAVCDDSIGPGNDIDAKLGPIIRRLSLLEEQFAASRRKDHEAVRQEEPVQVDRAGSSSIATAVIEATAAAQDAHSQLIWVTGEARKVERDFDNVIVEARALLIQLLDRELRQRVEATDVEARGSSPPAASSCTTECLSLRLEALEMHVNARLESVEESVCNCCDALQKEIQKNAAHHADEKLNFQTMLSRSIEVERAARCKLFDEERSRNEERQAALTRALLEELEASIVAQAVAEVRKAACTAAREEAKAEVERIAPPKEQNQSLDELHQKVSDLEHRWKDSSSLSSTLSYELAGSEAANAKHGLIGSGAEKGVMALEQFGVSVVQLENNINSLLKSSLEARAEQTLQLTNVKEEIKQLRGEMNTDVAKVWEQLQRLQVGKSAKVEAVCKENPLVTRTCSASPPPSGVPRWHLAMVPSPVRARSPIDCCSKSQGSSSLSNSVAVRVASPPAHADPTAVRSPSAHGHIASGSVSVEVEAGSRGRAISPGRPRTRGGKMVIPGPPRRPAGT